MSETSFHNWYDENADEYNAQRRARYKKDKEYRARVQAYTRRYRSENPRRARLDDGSVTIMNATGQMVRAFRTGGAASRLGVTSERIRNLEKQGYIPVAIMGDAKARLYTEKQITLVALAFRIRKCFLAGEITNQARDKSVKQIKEEWKK